MEGLTYGYVQLIIQLILVQCFSAEESYCRRRGAKVSEVRVLVLSSVSPNKRFEMERMENEPIKRALTVKQKQRRRRLR